MVMCGKPIVCGNPQCDHSKHQCNRKQDHNGWCCFTNSDEPQYNLSIVEKLIIKIFSLFNLTTENLFDFYDMMDIQEDKNDSSSFIPDLIHGGRDNQPNGVDDRVPSK